jgi:hypothetical protein
MDRIPKRLVFVAILLFPAIGVFYLLCVTKILEIAGHEGLVWELGLGYYYVVAISGIGVVCYATWSLLRFRPFGRWLGLLVCCAVPVLMLVYPVGESPFHSARQIVINRCLICLPFVCAAYYLLSRHFRQLYSAAKQVRQSKHTTGAEQPPAGARLKAPHEG